MFLNKKSSVALIFALLFFGVVKAQKYKEMQASYKHTVKEIQQEANTFFKTKDKGRGSGYKQYKRWEYHALRNQDQNGYLKNELFYYNQIINSNAKKNTSNFNKTSSSWQELGPDYYNATSSWAPGVGRITSVAIDNNNANIIIVGGQTGGVWKTTDGATTWSVLTDNMPSLQVYSLTIDPTNSSTYYWGGANGMLFKSTDAGVSWNMISTLNTNAIITEILIDPTNANKMYCTASSFNNNGGIFKSTDAGQTWSSITAGIIYGFDVKFKPGDYNTVYASGNDRFFKSTDGGATFNAVSNFNIGAKMIGVSANAPNVVYVLESNNNGTFGALYKSTDSGDSFTQLNHTGKNYFGYSSSADDNNGQAPRDMDIVVNPNNANEVHIAGILTWLSLDGGVTFNVTSQWQPSVAASENIGYCHADIDILIYQNNKLYAGTDGGLYVANNPQTVNNSYYTNLSTGLGIRQFYKMGVSQTNPEIVTAGSQDNGTGVYTTSGNWLDWLGADGMESFVDKNNSNYLFGTSQFGELYISTNGGNDTAYTGLSEPENKRGNWVTPFEQDPTTSNVIYTGYDKVYKGEVSYSFPGFFQGLTWTSISQDFGDNLDHLKIAPSNNQIMYAAYDSNLLKTTDGGATNWTTLSGFSGSINSIAIHPTNPNKIAIATTSADKIYLSLDGGNSWTAKKLDLPDFSALSLVWYNHAVNDVLYLGMNHGIYYLTDNATNWTNCVNNLPNVQTGEIEINLSNNKIYTATYGRGLWSADLVIPSAASDIHDASASAITIASSSYASSNAQYTTVSATPDGTSTSCASGAPKNNVWFQFTATNASQSLFVLSGTTFGTLQNPVLSLWDSTANTEISCAQTTTTTAYLTIDNLVIGQTYLISVDNANTSDTGTFTLFGNDSALQTSQTLGVNDAGIIRYNNDLNKFQGWNGSQWVDFN